MISTGELKRGFVIELDNELWQVVEYNHLKLGRGSAQVRRPPYHAAPAGTSAITP